MSLAKTKKQVQKRVLRKPGDVAVTHPYLGSAPRREGPTAPAPVFPEKRGEQNYSTMRCGYVNARSNSEQQLGPGKYTLHSLSSVPYVTFVGAARQEKELSWGDICIVRENELVTVHNASYHPGDIVLSAGVDYTVPPRRLTVPVNLRFNAALQQYEPEFPVDCRRARSAWIVIFSVAGAATLVTKTGLSRERSHFTPSPQVPSGYSSTEAIAPGSQITYVSLGYRSVSTERGPMVLLDTALPRFSADISDPTTLSAYYLLEY